MVPQNARAAASDAPSADLLQVYLREVGRVALLSAELEVDLAHRIEVGIFAAERLAAIEADPGACPVLQRDLRTLVGDGARAKEHLVSANLRLVVTVAKRYVGRGLPLLDLVQEGNVGLIRAVEKFDCRRGYKFSTYAVWWIRQAVARSVADQGRTIRMPVHVLELVNRVGRSRRDLAVELGRNPTHEEVACRADVTVARVEELTALAVDPVSLHATVGADDSGELSELIEDTHALAPIDAVSGRLLARHVEDVLTCLRPHDRVVVELRFGLRDGKPRTFEEVAHALGSTREAVRQVEARTLAKLRQPVYAEQLRGYLRDEA